MIKFLKNHKLTVVILLAYMILLPLRPDLFLKALKNSQYYLFEMLTILPVIFMITVTIDVLLPKAWIVKQLGDKSGWKGIFLSFALGSLSAGPIYAAFPIAKSLHDKGASLKSLVIILSSWAVIKLPMLANEAKFLGFKFMFVRWLLTLIGILLMAQLMTWLRVKIKSDSSEIKQDLVILKDHCMLCMICVSKMPQIFCKSEGNVTLVDADMKVTNLSAQDLELLRNIKDQCPVGAIGLNEAIE